jgi:hypothetical protein
MGERCKLTDGVGLELVFEIDGRTNCQSAPSHETQALVVVGQLTLFVRILAEELRFAKSVVMSGHSGKVQRFHHHSVHSPKAVV